MTRGAKTFWSFILAFAAITIGLTIVAVVRAPTEYNPPPAKIAELFSEAAHIAYETSNRDLEAELNTVYAPVYAAIPKYLDFHYSVLGEYVELTEAAIGNMSTRLENSLYAGFETRLTELANEKDAELFSIYVSELKESIKASIPDESSHLPLGELTERAIANAQARMQTSVPLATATIGVLAASPLKATMAAMAKQIAKKIAAKTAVKGAAKGGAMLSGFGTGAVACSWSGPFAVGCGAIGAAAAWFVTDAVVISLDERFNRAEFATEIKRLIDSDKAQKLAAFQSALSEKLAVMEEVAEQTEKDFTMAELQSSGKQEMQ